MCVNVSVIAYWYSNISMYLLMVVVDVYVCVCEIVILHVLYDRVCVSVCVYVYSHSTMDGIWVF